MAYALLLNEQSSAGGSDTDGPVGTGARDFNGTNQKITGQVVTTADLTLLQGHWTVEAFVRPDAISAFHCIVAVAGTTGETSAENVQMNFTITDTGYLQVFWESGSGTNQLLVTTAGSPLSTGTWYHLCAVKTATHVRFYIDGVFIEQIAWSTNASVGINARWMIGVDSSNGVSWFNGAIRAVKLTRGVLDDAAIATSAALLATTATFPIDEDTHAIWHLGVDDELEFGSVEEPDTTEPEITILSPLPAAGVTKRSVITLELTDETGLASYVIIAEILDPDDPSTVLLEDVVHDGVDFGLHYKNTDNVVTAISGGYRLTIRRDDGWPGSPRFRYVLRDTSGNAGVIA